MDNKEIRRNLYKVLRKTGIPRNLINENAQLKEELLQDDLDMTCFLFYLESSFDLNIPNDEMPSLRSVGSTIDYLSKLYA
jgi:acyl carrier protein